MTITEAKNRASQLANSIFETVAQLGELIFMVEREFSIDNKNDFYEHLEDLGFGRADRSLFKAVYLHGHPEKAHKNDPVIDPRLFLRGARSSKLLATSDETQKRLLSKEKFQVAKPDGDVAEYTWSSMPPYCRAQILSRDGRILTPEEQAKSKVEHSRRRTSTPNQVLTKITIDGEIIKFQGESVVLICAIPAFFEVVNKADWEKLVQHEPIMQ